jgi:hypothetical protein
VADAYDFGRHRHLLDVGGGTGSFLVAILSRHPALVGTPFELPETAAVVRRMLANKPEAARIAVAEGDIFKGSPPEGADAVLIANVVHIFLPERNRELFRRVRSHVVNGARLLLLDKWTDPSHTSPQPAPLMAGEFLLFAGDGDVYSAEEVQVWLRETGWQPVEQVSVLGADSMIVAEAV